MNVSIAELKDHLSQVLSRVEDGEEVAVCRRNVPVAKLVPLPSRMPNRTVLGRDRGSATIKSDLTEPALDEADWDMLADGGR